jgi:thiosulfate reductase cytochrome b subunit
VITADGTARRSCRGLEGESGTFKSLITGYQPVVLARETVDGDIKLAPYNLVTAWFWVYGSPERPVRQMDLKIAWLDGEDYHPAVTALFDVDGSGFVEENELVLDSTEKVSLIATRLETLGLENPYIVGEIQPYSISHTVTNGEWVTRDCQTCHSEDSRLTRPFLLADYVPAGVIPQFVSDTNTLTAGDIYQTAQGEMYYQPSLEEQGVYVLGYDSVRGVDRTGALIFLGVLAGVITHSGVRVWTARRTPLKERGVKRVFMYSVYERLWHWLQTTAILILTFTGLIMHNPDGFRIFDFRYVVLVHNIIAFILAVNAFLALFYNLVSGDLRRFIPKPQGFFNQAIRQMLYYLRGMFRGEHHPFEKTREERLNPLQKITYIGILNVLLPLQGITGILIWGAQRWPAWASRFGGLAFLGPFHTLIAWLFASFIVLHVYLTTTGHTPLAGIQSMVFGWDELEVHSPDHEEMAET